MKAVIVATAMAVGFASYASAAEVKKDTKKAPVVASKAMSDSDMDKVMAGNTGVGVGTAPTDSVALNAGPVIFGTAAQASGIQPGFGVATAAQFGP
jgi:hypothetical protein